MVGKYSLTYPSKNSKTGEIAVTRSHRGSCNPDCPFMKNGCYADGGPEAIWWDRLSDPEHSYGSSFIDHLRELAALALKSRGWIKLRLHTAGDLPQPSTSPSKLRALLKVAGRFFKSWTYTHWTSMNDVRYIEDMSHYGCTVNLSLTSPEDAVIWKKENKTKLPLTCLTSSNASKRSWVQDEVTFVQCPATWEMPDGGQKITCDSCGHGDPLCARMDRKFVVTFPAHGMRKGQIDKLLQSKGGTK